MQIYKNIKEIESIGQISANSLVNADCLEAMKYIADKSIDLILCDLPYKMTECEWDNIIPFKPLWKQYERIIKDNGAIVLFGSQPFTSKLILSNIKMFREELIWLKNKSGSGLQAKQKHIKVHEQILVFSKNGKYTYNSQKWLVDKKEFLTQRKTFNEIEVGNNIYSKMIKKQKVDDGTRNPISIVSCKVPFTPSKRKTYSNKDVDLRFHPTQKPVALLEYLIKTYTNEGETVLDNCMGSGSTIVACKNTKRQFIGIELDKNYFDISVQRIQNNINDTHNNINNKIKENNIKENQVSIFDLIGEKEQIV